ncbi:MAG: hypothetical protein ACT4NL_13665 [Pseudomarimonas sp.]
MPWLFFALALGAILVAFKTFSIGLAAVCLLAALGLSIAGALNLASARISDQSQNPARMLDAKALDAIRKRAAADKAEAESATNSAENADAGHPAQMADAEPNPR